SHHGSTFYQHEAFARAVRGEGPVLVSAHDGLMAVAIGTAAEISARTPRGRDRRSACDLIESQLALVDQRGGQFGPRGADAVFGVDLAQP
ncbi:hypothetical protein ABTL53_19430, partial [Acinetobacter baumannii]